MSRSTRLRLIVALPLVCAALVWLRFGVGSERQGLSGPEATEEEELAGPRDLVGVEFDQAPLDAEEVELAVRAPSGPGGAREALASEPGEPQPEVASLVPDLAGVVLDARDRPLAGVVVRFGTRLTMDFEVRISSLDFIADPQVPGQGLVQVSDSRGQFLFEGIRGDHPGTLHFGERLVLGKAFSQVVDAEKTWQVLRVPDLAARTATVRVRITDAESGELLQPESVEVDAFSSMASGTPRPTVQVRRGEAELRLGVGRWRIWACAPFGEGGEVIVQVKEPGGLLERKLALRTFDAAGASMVEATVDPAELPPVDDFGGFATRYAEVRRTGYRGKQSDRHFIHSVGGLGHGPFSAGTLIVELRSISGMSHNDGIYLEYQGEGKFAWSAAIRDLPGVGGWRRGETATLRLDLGALPGRDGGPPVDLLPHLADGTLDVLIQDDTSVERLDVWVVR